MTDWPAVPRDRFEIYCAAAGYVTLSDFWLSETSTFVATSGTIYGRLMGCRAGDRITGLVLRCTQTATGTLTGNCRIGLADSNGVMLAVSNLLNTTTPWTVGVQQNAFTAPYTIPADGGYYGVFLVSTFATQMPGFRRGGVAGDMNALAGMPPEAFTWTGQSDLPAVAASLTFQNTNSINPPTMGLY